MTGGNEALCISWQVWLSALVALGWLRQGKRCHRKQNPKCHKSRRKERLRGWGGELHVGCMFLGQRSPPDSGKSPPCEGAGSTSGHLP